MSILFRADKENAAKHEEEYTELFSNPFPAAVRGQLGNQLEVCTNMLYSRLICVLMGSVCQVKR